MGLLVLCGLLGFLFMVPSKTSADPDCSTDSQIAERAANAVELKFYRIKTDEWNSGDSSSKVAVRVSDQANSYCASDPAACGLQDCCSSEFKDVSVNVVSGYPQAAENEKDLKLKISVDFPSDLNASGTLQCVLGAGTVRELVGNVRQGIFDDTGSWITYVDTDFYGIPPDHRLNAIIIPIAFVVVLGIILAAVILHFWNKRREAVARRQKIIERRKAKTARVAPYTSEKVPKEGEKVDQPKSEKPRRKDEMYKENLRNQYKTLQKTSSIHSEDSAIKLDNEPRQRKTYSYDNTDQSYADGATGIGRPAKHLHPIEREPDEISQIDSERKKKKKKKHKRHRDQEAYENAGYDGSAGARDQETY